MSFLAILTAIGLEQWRAFNWRAGVERAFVRYARWIERNFNGGTLRHGWYAIAAAVLPPILIAGGLYWSAWALHPAAAFVWKVIVLYFLMGFRRFSHAVSAIVKALHGNDLAAARRALGEWRGGSTAEFTSQDVARLAIERGITDAYRQVFAVIFWVVVLPGPAGAVLYRAVALLAEEWKMPAAGIEPSAPIQARVDFGRPARQLLALLDWIPVRLTALSFAVVGDFEDAVACWRSQASLWARQEGGLPIGILLASGAGALGVLLGGPLPMLVSEPDVRPELGIGTPVEPEMLPSAVGLVWRALVLWLLLILLLTIAYLLP